MSILPATAHRLLAGLAPPSFPCEAPTEAKAHSRDHQDAQVGGHQPHGIGDVLQVQPVKGRRVHWSAQEGGCQQGGWGPSPWAWKSQMEAEGVLPRDPDKPGEVLPVAACGERHRGTGSGGWALNTPSRHQEALGAPEARNAWSPGPLWLVSGMLKNTVFTDRETEAQPGKPGGAKALQFCPAGPQWPGGWARLSDHQQSWLLPGGWNGEAWPQSHQDQISARHLTSLQFLTCRRGAFITE